jgi:DNA repair exonuclease SbcCD ATPase subunit
MIKFEKLTLRNFLSFGNNLTEIDLQNSGTTLIVGENMDQGGSSRFW